MGENRNAVELKKARLRAELSKPKEFQDKFVIRRLEESIKRHKKIGKQIRFSGRLVKWKQQKKQQN